MNKSYWLRRKRAALAMARAAMCSEPRLSHYNEAGRHSVRAAYAPFMLPRKGPATEGERDALRRPSSAPPSRAIVRTPPPFPRGHKSAGSA